MWLQSQKTFWNHCITLVLHSSSSLGSVERLSRIRNKLSFERPICFDRPNIAWIQRDGRPSIVRKLVIYRYQKDKKSEEEWEKNEGRKCFVFFWQSDCRICEESAQRRAIHNVCPASGRRQLHISCRCRRPSSVNCRISIADFPRQVYVSTFKITAPQTVLLPKCRSLKADFQWKQTCKRLALHNLPTLFGLVKD